MGYLISIIIFQTVFTLGLLVANNKNKDGFERLLTLFLSFILLHFIDKLGIYLAFGTKSPLYTLQTSFGYFYGPMLFIITLNSYQKIHWKTILLHLTPFNIATILYFIALITIYNGYTQTTFLKFYKNTVWAEVITMIVYPILAYLLLRKQQLNIATEKYILLRNLIVIMSLFVIIATTIIPVITNITGLDIDIRTSYIFMLCMVIAIVLYRIKTYNTQEIHLPVNPPIKNTIDSPKYSNSNLANEDLENYKRILESYFKKEKPYLDSELTLQILSEKVNIPKHHLTQLLNTHLNKNFYHYVNEYRIKQVIEQMEASRFNKNIIDVAFEAGFNSKSSFNNYFKKFTGKTPSEFKKEQSLTT